MDKIKCITFDKNAQDSLPEHIKAKMKADREKVRADSVLSNLKNGRKFTGQNGAFSGIITPWAGDRLNNSLSVELYLQGGSTWHEVWDLQHTIWGFENGDYKWID